MGRIAQWLAYSLLNPALLGSIPSVPKILLRLIYGLEESEQ